MGEKRGFAGMTPEEHLEICRNGGRAAHKQGVAHRFGEGDEARRAGRKGGKKTASDPEHMAEIGRKGGRARSEKLKGKEK